MTKKTYITIGRVLRWITSTAMGGLIGAFQAITAPLGMTSYPATSASRNNEARFYVRMAVTLRALAILLAH